MNILWQQDHLDKDKGTSTQNIIACLKKLNTNYASEGPTVISEKDWGTNGTSPTRAHEMRVGRDGTCEINFFFFRKGHLTTIL